MVDDEEEDDFIIIFENIQNMFQDTLRYSNGRENETNAERSSTGFKDKI